MAETFNNYLTTTTFKTSNDKYVVIVPEQNEALTSATSTDLDTVGIGIRTKDSITQLHSIYITKEVNSASERDNPLANALYISLGIYDTVKGTEVCLAQNVMVLPCSSFYIEKAVTLLPDQQLRLTYTSLNGAVVNKKIHTVCSGIDLT